MLRCPHCRREIAHKDRKGGVGFIVQSRYLRVALETRRILVACPECRQEILLAQLVAEKRVAG